MIDFLCSERQYIDHCAPIWFALDPSERGSFVVAPRARAHAALLGIDHGGPPGQGAVVVVASYADERRVRRRPVVLVEHGAGQNYGPGTHPSYSGGSRHDVALFLCPNETVAARWRACYPHSRVEVVGSPRMDRWYGEHRGGGQHDGLPRGLTGQPVVAFATHWDCHLWPESRNAWPTFSLALSDLTEHFTVLGHGHPRILRSLVPTYARYGIEVVEDFDEVLERAQVLVCDNSSVLFEFASLDRPVVLLNAPHYRRDVEHGLRFWTHADIGPQVDDPAALVPAIREAITGSFKYSMARRKMADAVFPLRDGRAAERAADAIRRLVAESDFTPRRQPVPHNPKAARTGGGARRLPEVSREEPQALTGVVRPLTVGPSEVVVHSSFAPHLPQPGTVDYAELIALSLSFERLRGPDGQPLDLPVGHFGDEPQPIRW